MTIALSPILVSKALPNELLHTFEKKVAALADGHRSDLPWHREHVFNHWQQGAAG